ncbi:MAG: hypothetical protein SFZ23_00605 [Planctomycetota bacterium]|nr:hypothetical protein [Planctomycetota bacterium]
MKKVMNLGVLALVAGLAVPAVAQDSVSRNADGGNGLPGDAFRSNVAGPNQKAAYAVDLADLTTSWGTRFGIAPIVKSSKTSAPFFGSLISAQSISQTIKVQSEYASASYASWLATPGAGVNPAQNLPADTVAPCGTGSTFSVGFSDFATESLTASNGAFTLSHNNIITGNASFSPRNPGRLYVTRVTAATGSPEFNPALPIADNDNRSEFGYGAVDADGDVTFRADDFQNTGVTDRLIEDNIFRVRSLDRTNAVNLIDQTPTSDAAATDWIVRNSTVSYNPPSIVPSDLSGGTSAVIGSNFSANYYFESAPNTISQTPSHRTVTQNQRGQISFSNRALFGGVGTVGMLMKDASAGDADVFGFNLWGVNADGSIIASNNFRVPAGVQDRCNGFVFPAGATPNWFDHYHSQTAFRGGPQVAIGQDRQGRGLGAAVLVSTLLSGNNNPLNAIAAVRFNPASPSNSQEWGLVAWVDPANTGTPLGGKAILDGPGGTAVGRLAQLFEIPGAPFGPSMSAPAFDSVGNVWFLASAELFNRLPGGGSDFDTCLIRAVYDEARFCWELELVLEVGDRFTGVNSGLDYQIRFLGIADGDSVSSGTLWANNVPGYAWNNVDPSLIASNRDPRTLGGLVVAAEIVYDVGGPNGQNTPDGRFDDPSGTSTTPNSRDEAYQALIYIGSKDGYCAGDYNIDGQIDFFDYLDFSQAFAAEDCSADFNNDGQVDFFDFLDFGQAFSEECSF